MDKRILPLAFALLLVLPVFVGPGAACVPPKEYRIPNKNHLIYASIVEPESSDPAWAYDDSSSEMIMNVYETLIFWPWERVPTDPHEFEPQLADYWIVPGDPDYPGIAAGAPAGTVETWYFHVRPNVPYHNPIYGNVRPSDVEYCIERGMVFDHVNGPQWMFYMVLLNGGSSLDWDDDPVGAPGHGTLEPEEAAVGGPLLDGAVESDDNTRMVWFNLAIPYPAFIQILAQSWGAVYPQAWGADLAADGRFFWPGWSYVTLGRVGATPYDSWADYNDQTHAQLIAPTDNPTTVVMGTGPYKFDYWTKGDTWQVLRFENYWRGWPSDNAWTYYGGPTSSSYFDVFTHKLVVSWPARRSMFLSNLADTQADIVDVPGAYIGDVDGQPGVQGVKDLPALQLNPAMFFNYRVNPSPVYFTTQPKLGGTMKLDLFSDKHMRKAFAHALDYDTYLISAFPPGEAFQPATPIVKGLAQYNATKEKYHYSLALVQAELQQAWAGAPGGSAWDQGFYVPLTYNTGNRERRIACEMIQAAIQGIPPPHGPFSVDVFALDWGSAFLPAMRLKELTNFFDGWIWDYADADNGVVPFMHPLYGTYARRQTVKYINIKAADFAPNSGRADPATGMYRRWDGTVFNVDVTDLGNVYVGDLIDAAARGSPAERLAMYSEIEDIYYAAAASIPLAQSKVRYWQRDWVRGWYFNPIGPGGKGLYVYRMWKGIAADTNGDGIVDGADITPINKHCFWFDGFFDPVTGQWVIFLRKIGLAGYNRIADIVCSAFEIPMYGGRTWELDGTIIDDGTMIDYLYHCPLPGYEIPGIDGLVDDMDSALVSAHLHDYVTAY